MPFRFRVLAVVSVDRIVAALAFWTWKAVVELVVSLKVAVEVALRAPDILVVLRLVVELKVLAPVKVWLALRWARLALSDRLLEAICTPLIR